ncbi:MAG TPA: gamma-glutamyltransferase [Candidatus Sulfotelmatobacter sp.]|nr:gamma-glutamyltransferase [Candidatus Sulfotelmatobacter sp.]
MRKLRVFALLILSAAIVHAQDRGNARSMVISRFGIVASSQVQASQAGAEILAHGGSAADAAIATNAVLGVLEPDMNGIGGDLFAIYWDAKTKTLYGLNSSGWAPKALTIEHLKARDVTKMPTSGIDTVTVPGAVEGWNKLHERFGRMAWKELFTPAIYYAENGFPVQEFISMDWHGATEYLKKDPESRRVFLVDDQAPRMGQMFKNPDVGKALRLIADGGAQAYYKGDIARAILATEKELGGTMAADDLAEFSAEWVDPISTTYRGWKVYELPPNGQGMAALEMLNIMEQFSPAKEGPLSTEEIHTRVEAMKLAYADLAKYNADPRFAKVPVSGLLSKEYAKQRAQLINPQKANCNVDAGRPPEGDTTYFTVVDREGNIVSLIQSNFSGFGSGITVRGMGFALQNRGALFMLDPNVPDSLVPRKRPFHTIIPAFMEHGDDHIGFGIMGGANQPLAHAQFVSNVVDYGMNLQLAMETARFTVRSNFNIACNILIEDRVAAAVRQQLTSMGHQLDVRGDFSIFMGRGQAIDHNTKTGINFAASDARTDGSAEPEFPPEIRLP